MYLLWIKWLRQCTYFESKHYIAPFLGHVLGTLVGAFVVAKFAASNNFKLAMFIGVFFLLGCIMAVKMLPGSCAFETADLLLAYLPMAWLGATLAGTRRSYG